MMVGLRWLGRRRHKDKAKTKKGFFSRNDRHHETLFYDGLNMMCS
jgi:hypothetical protein